MTSASPVSRVLVLAGTAEARALCAALADTSGVAVTASLSGAVAAPAAYAAPVRVGGFGGAEGLAGYLREAGVDAMVDATHPFAQRISAAAATAAAATGAPLLRLARPGWRAAPGDAWRRFPDLAALLAAIPPGARAFAALGGRAAPALAARPDVAFVLRAVDPPAALPPNVTVVCGRAVADVAAEAGLLRAAAATHLLARDAGGEAGRAKLTAAGVLGLAVFVLDRPPAPPSPSVETVPTVGQAAAWVRSVAGVAP